MAPVRLQRRVSRAGVRGGVGASVGWLVLCAGLGGAKPPPGDVGTAVGIIEFGRGTLGGSDWSFEGASWGHRAGALTLWSWGCLRGC
eukprot:9261858-Alexandrium_andersonii.AAC.1